MNEWSFQEYYYSLNLANSPPDIQPPCDSRIENLEDKNFKIMNNYRIRGSQKTSDVANGFLNEDIGIPSSAYKKKKIGASDPRFKKIIDTDYRNVGNLEAPKVKIPSTEIQTNKSRNLNGKSLSYLKTPNDRSMYKTSSIRCTMNQRERELSAEVTKDTNCQPSDKYTLNDDIKEFSSCEIPRDLKEEFLNATAKLKSNYKTDLKRSASDCTIQTKTLFIENESSENVRAYPSAAKILNVDNWMKQQKTYPEKRRSVVTVIGQTQTKPFDQILNEIHQRRKLAKELDKHALCEALMSSMDSHSDFKNVVAKVDLVLPDGKVIYSTEKVYTRKNNKLDDRVYSQNSMEIFDTIPNVTHTETKRKKCDMIPERDSSTCQLGKRRLKRSNKKSVSTFDESIRIGDNLKHIIEVISPQVLWFLLGILCFGLSITVLLYSFKTPQTYYILKIFKPKTTAWYEKLLFL